ncbi:MAG: hypothetical protein HQ501_02320 [Rhodospirillales bacterium]|nr:hypothetical protein [Rhodospirillales bacterium]
MTDALNAHVLEHLNADFSSACALFPKSHWGKVPEMDASDGLRMNSAAMKKRTYVEP